MANHEKFSEVLFKTFSCLDILLILIVFSSVLIQVADPEQSNIDFSWQTGLEEKEGPYISPPSHCSPDTALALPAQAR